jgi:predicted porin
MNKKLIAVAIAAALAPAVAMADSGNVQIYGSVHMSIDSLKGNSSLAGTDNESEMNISSNSSYIGFKGSEDLGNGLKAIWQMENQVAMGDTGGTTNSWTSRNSYAGLSGNFGTAILGIHDTPVKLLGRKVDLFGDQIGDSRNLISAADGVNAMWDLRPSNVIAYISPTVGGFHGAIAYVSNLTASSVNQATGALTTSGAGATQEESVTAWSALGMYESGPVMVGLGYEKHNLSNLNGSVLSLTSPTATVLVDGMEDEKIWRLVGGYNFGDFKAVGLYQKASDIFGANGLNRKTWGLGGAYKMGATTIKAQYYKADDASGCGVVDCSATGASMFAIGADYALSKRTTAYAAYAKTSNDDEANFSAFGGGHGDNPGTVLGKNPSGFSLGMKHAF